MQAHHNRKRAAMRLTDIFIRLGTFGLAGLLSLGAADLTVRLVESRSVIAVQDVLAENEHRWTEVLADGLQVVLQGTAPTEAARFRAISAAGGVVDASRVIDNMSVVDQADFTPPEFKIEILRNDSGVSLIGLIPAATNRDALARRITTIAGGQAVTDLLESGDYPQPETWRAAVDYALYALRLLPRSKISVSADRVIIKAIAESQAEKRRLETTLTRARPGGVRLALDINAPRPVISPFTTRFILDADGPRFDACAADTAEARDEILQSARAAGLAQTTSCTLALGSPSPDWARAVSLSIAAVAQLGGGTVTLADTDISLIAPEGTPQDQFDDAIGTLENNLPDVFAMTAELPAAPNASPEGPPRFTATRSPEGLVQLRGRIPDEMTNLVARNFAAAKFGERNVTMGTRVVDDLPAGWAVRVLAGIEVLSQLANGAVVVEPDILRITGNTGDETASAEISRILVDQLGQGTEFDLNITYVEALDPIAALPTADECIAKIFALTEERKITFDPGSASITAAALPVIDEIAEVLRLCGDLPIRVSGYTDSQGREEMNLRLSQDRADAVLTALRARRVPVSTFEAVGYGEADPIADNATEEGREANRRIAFSLFDPAAVAPPADAAQDDAAPTPDTQRPDREQIRIHLRYGSYFVCRLCAGVVCQLAGQSLYPCDHRRYR
jgi:OmpA-OmpF porin, OOP family